MFFLWLGKKTWKMRAAPIALVVIVSVSQACLLATAFQPRLAYFSRVNSLTSAGNTAKANCNSRLDWASKAMTTVSSGAETYSIPEIRIHRRDMLFAGAALAFSNPHLALASEGEVKFH